MDPKPTTGYILALSISDRVDQKLNKTSLDILEHFAWRKLVSSYQIYSDLRSTEFKMAYKNVNKRVNSLFSLGLIEASTNYVEKNKHKAKYYRLSEYGIYQLFLHRLNSLLVNQSDVRRSKELTSNASVFFNNYSNCRLFKVFLYPYFSKGTLFAIRDRLLWDLYGYLSNCCQIIERNLKLGGIRDIPIIDKIFSWNKVPGDDDKLLLSHLKQVFNLESIESVSIIKEGTDEKYPSITVKTSSAPIVIRLDKARNKVIIMSTVDNGRYKALEYDVHQLGQELVVGNRIPDEESIKHIIDEAEKQIEQLIYQFVYDLASSTTNSDISKEFSYYYKILSQDDKFMRVVEKIYENRHKGFEQGCELLRKYKAKR